MLVVIVGAGPTGLAAANLLGKAGIETLVIERNSGLSTHPKAIAIDDEGLRICQAMGLRDAMLAHILLDVPAHYISRGRYLAKVAPTKQRHGYPLVSTFYQPAFEAVLLAGLERFSCVKLLFQHTVEALEQDEHGLTLAVRTPSNSLLQVKCAYLLACDGGQSTIRHLLDIPLRPPTWRDLLTSREGAYSSPTRQARRQPSAQQWLVVDCLNDMAPTTPAPPVIFFCNPARPAVTVPVPDGARRWEFMLLPGERPEDLLSSKVIRSLIQQARSTQPARAMDLAGSSDLRIIRKAIYTFHSTLAASFSSGERIFLLGDAAHLMPPFGGQGMNCGLRDAFNLCWKLQMILQEQATSRLLASYEQERVPHAARMIFFSTLLGHLVMPTARPLASLRDAFFRSANTLPPLREFLSEMRVKPRSRYNRGFLLPARRVARFLTGSLLPQPRVLAADGSPILLDDALGDSFALLRLYENPGLAFTPVRGEVWQRLGVRCVCVLPMGSSSPCKDKGYPYVIDHDGQLSALLRGNRDLFVLVRPDRYVMGAFPARQADEFAEELQELLLSA